MENKFVKIWIEEGIIYICYKQGVRRINLATAQMLVKNRLQVSGGIKRPMIIYLQNLIYIDAKTKRYFSHDEEAIKDITVGAFVAEHPIIYTLARLFHREHSFPFPSKVFKTREQALKWISKYTEVSI